MSYSLAFRLWSAFRNGYKKHQFDQQKDDYIEVASEDSFPASDPPAWIKVTHRSGTNG